MNAQHTPGPWVVGDNEDSVLGATRTIIVAKCNVGPERFQPVFETVKANARLIAAAPELLETLEVLVGELKGEGCTEAGWPELRDACAAIAKAKGGAA